MGAGNAARKTILLMSTGGTIASRYDPVAKALISVAGGDELLAAMGSLAPDVNIIHEAFSNVGSNRINLEMQLRLARRVDELLDNEEIHGCVITHGTDTLEEGAFLSRLALITQKPVIFTGSQRGADEPDADGPRNLADAIAVAASNDAAGLGPLVVFSGRILSALDATKIDTLAIEAFGARSFGPVGEVDRGKVSITRRPWGYPTIKVKTLETKVDLITLTLGCDDRLFEAAVNSGARGIVLQGFGSGNATTEIVSAVDRATGNGVVTVVTSRCFDGRVLPLYGDGGGRDLQDAGAIFAGRLQGPKARILLCAALANIPISDIADVFEQFGR